MDIKKKYGISDALNERVMKHRETLINTEENTQENGDKQDGADGFNQTDQIIYTEGFDDGMWALWHILKSIWVDMPEEDFEQYFGYADCEDFFSEFTLDEIQEIMHEYSENKIRKQEIDIKNTLKKIRNSYGISYEDLERYLKEVIINDLEEES